MEFLKKHKVYFKLFYETCLVVLLSLIALIVTTYFWLLDSERSLNFLKPFLSEKIALIDPNIKYEDATISLLSKDKILRFEIKKFSHQKTKINNFILKVDLKKLLINGQINHDLELNNGQYEFTNSPNNESNEDFHIDAFVAKIKQFPIKQAIISNLTLVKGNKKFNIKKIIAKKNGSSLNGEIDSDILSNKIEFKLKEKEGKVLEFTSNLGEINLTKTLHFTNLNIEHQKIANNILPKNLIGQIAAEISLKKNEITKFTLDVSSPKDDGFQLKMNSYHNFAEINIEKIALNIAQENQETLSFLANGKITPAEGQNLKTNKYDFSVSAKNVNTEFVAQNWPKNAMPLIREWSVENVYDAFVKNAEGRVLFFDDLNLQHLTEIDIKANVEKAKIEYLSQYPKLENVQALLHFTQNHLEIEVENAQMANGKISFATAKIPFKENENITIKGNYLTANSTSEKFIPNSVKRLLKDKLDINLLKLEGESLVNTDIKIPMKDDLKLTDISMIFNFDVKHYGIPNKIINHPKNEANFSLTLESGDIILKGNLLHTGNKGDFNWRFTEKENGQMLSNGQAMLYFSSQDFIFYGLKNLMGELIEFPRGIGQIKLKYDEKQSAPTIQLEADLENAYLKTKFINCEKTAGENLNLNLNGLIKPDSFEIVDAKINGKNIAASFNIKQGKNFILNAPSIQCQKNIFNVQLNNSDLKIVGKSVDLRGLALGEKKQAKKAVKQAKKQSITKANVSFDKIILESEHNLKNLKITYDCPYKEICKNINGKIFDNEGMHSEIKLDKQNGKQILKITSKNLADLLHSFGLYQKLNGGDLTVNATTSQNPKDGLKGSLSLINFNVTKDSILSHLLSLISLDVLALKPHHKFSKFTSDLQLVDNKIIFTNGIMKGSDMSLEINGEINFATQKINLKGIIAPSVYGVNKIVGKIPLFGNLITGGSSGVIAVSYSIKGDFDNVKTFVNPLSIITPGILKKLF